ncbi:MAG: sigma-70 family RNA polymerase sigma factor [Chitinophagaceae bacterium]|nr:sigma-70 family RNA polymerase sigma factor [Chitinophagaceae bacterium]MCW5927599.1 sigma-70 family RNA polymerase sigma factor [Chitinophagaceae bacterium]
MNYSRLYIEKGDNELASMIADGDENAFKELYLRCLPGLVSTGRKILKSEELISEVIQEALVRLWVHREKLYGVDSPRAWVWRIFSNECFRYLKKYGLQHVSLESLPEWYAPSLSNSAEQVCLMHETHKVIHQAVTSLSPRQREIYTLSREVGLKTPEIAVKLGLSYKYVKKTLAVALQNIRQALIRSGKSLLFIGIILICK